MRSGTKRIGITMIKAVKLFSICNAVADLSTSVRSSPAGSNEVTEGHGQRLGRCHCDVIVVGNALYRIQEHCPWLPNQRGHSAAVEKGN